MDLKLSTARNRVFSFAGVSITSLSVTISKDGGAFASPVGSLTQIGSTTFYNLALDAADVGTLGDLAYQFTDTVLGVIAPDNGDVDQVVPVAPDVTLADGVAHGGTPGSSTATLALERARFESTADFHPALWLNTNGNNSPAFYMSTSGSNSETMALQAGDYSSIGLRVSGGGQGIAVHGFSNDVNPGQAIVLTTEVDGDGTQSTNVVEITAQGGHGIIITSDGATKHDINLAGSGDIKGDFVVPADGIGQATGIMGMIFYLYQRFFGKKIYDKIGNTVKTYQSDGTTVRTTQTTSSDSSADEIDAAS